MSLDVKTEEIKVESVSNSEAVIPAFLQKLLEMIAGREGFKDGYTIVSRSGSNVGDGFIGLLLSVVISGTRNGKSDELVLICKIPPLNDLRQKFSVAAFQQEIASYEILLPALVQFQQEKGIEESEGFYAFPKCYGTYADEKKLEFAIVLEDLRQRGFRMFDKLAQIDYQHVKLAYGELGKFHALSFALRQQRPEAFKQISSMGSILLKMMDSFPEFEDYYEANFDTAIGSLDPDDKDELQKLNQLRTNFKATLRSSVSGTNAEPFAVFCHGDLWTNNLMYKYSSADSLEPQSVIIIDWQLTQYCSPVTDFTYYLYASTEQPLRAAHFEDLLHDYYDNLAVLLKRLGGNVEKQFSLDDLQRHLETFAIFGLIMAPVQIQVCTVNNEDLPDMDAMTKENAKNFNFLENGLPDGFNKRMRDVIRDFIGRGYLGDNHFALKDATGKKNQD